MRSEVQGSSPPLGYKVLKESLSVYSSFEHDRPDCLAAGTTSHG